MRYRLFDRKHTLFWDTRGIERPAYRDNCSSETGVFGDFQKEWIRMRCNTFQRHETTCSDFMVFKMWILQALSWEIAINDTVYDSRCTEKFFRKCRERKPAQTKPWYSGWNLVLDYSDVCQKYRQCKLVHSSNKNVLRKVQKKSWKIY